MHSTQLKNRILAASSDFEAKNIGREVYLTFKEEIGQILQNVYLEDDDEEDKYLAKAVNVVRREMFEMTSNFDGTFSSGCQINAVPKTLLILMDMIMNGSNLKSKYHTVSEPSEKQAILTVFQLIMFKS